MPTSSDTTFDSSALQIISDCLANVGALGPGKTATGRMFDHGLRLLNEVVKAIDADGSFLWRSARRTFTTVSGTAAYTTAADVISIDEPLNYKRAASSSRSPIRLISRDDFMLLGDLTQAGLSTHAFVEQTLPTTMTVTFWPVPDASGDTITYPAFLRAQDYDTGANTGDFPSRWVLALKYGLTAELAMPYMGSGGPGLALAREMRNAFVAERERQMNASQEKGATYLVPWGMS